MIGSEAIKGYLTRLASRQCTPGGGAAAALHAAQGAALVAMVACCTSGAKYEKQAASLERITRVADGLVAPALRLAVSDEQAFQSVIDSYNLPTYAEQLKTAKKAAIDAALVEAAHVPTQLIGVARRVVDLADELFDIANVNVISDVAAAADAGLLPPPPA